MHFCQKKTVQQNLQKVGYFALVIFFVSLAGCSLKGHKKTYSTSSNVASSKGQRGTKPYIISGKKYYPLESARGFRESGIASWYGKDFHGKNTANGERYNMYGMTAAHKTLPLGTTVRVINKKNGRSVVVRINDRGPFVDNRIIDLTKTAADKLGMLKEGTAPVTIVALNGSATTRETYTSQKIQGKQSSRENKETFYIQAGAFSSKANAVALSTRLKDSGAQTRIIQDSNSLVWKVQAGPYTTLLSAQKATSSIKGFVVAE